ncbi:thioredoxin family protein [Aestuariibaculum suncheonense]|uniref:Thioredoxin family protein n=1 Tax=Aestuariibaculum suncheonense TaxID=1028745 RepID=A0A8J6UFM3_9FLAO|nr:thioredoxin domain-containing protein [Aestuariibaculum suncheonense]MBD0834389.1 thioredoxin family protein [Aestuariibaculum suncheonense]
MKKLFISGIVLLILGMSNVFAQGINFHHISLEEALEKAENENKLVFIDFYTVWCGPCKILAKYVFPQEKVGELFNKEFISIKLDAEKQGAPAARKYGVNVYPTLLFLNSKGEVVCKGTGSISEEKFIELGKTAITSANSEYSLAKLQEDYPNKQDDEHFLKIYFNKMIEYGQSPVEGIEAWLKVQTEIEEDDVDMMEFLIEHMYNLTTGGKAEEILDINYEEYMDIATLVEEVRLKTLKANMASKTLNEARKKKSPELMREFMNKWNELDGKYRKQEDSIPYEMEYHILAKDINEYKKITAAYMDDLISENSPEKVKEMDHKAYIDYKTAFEDRPTRSGLAKLKDYEEGFVSSELLRNVDHKVRTYFSVTGNTKKSYKTVKEWIEYAYSLKPNSYLVDNLNADILNKLGKSKQALELKQAAYNNWPAGDRMKSRIKSQLDKMISTASL